MKNRKAESKSIRQSKKESSRRVKRKERKIMNSLCGQGRKLNRNENVLNVLEYLISKKDRKSEKIEST